MLRGKKIDNGIKVNNEYPDYLNLLYIHVMAGILMSTVATIVQKINHTVAGYSPATRLVDAPHSN